MFATFHEHTETGRVVRINQERIPADESPLSATRDAAADKLGVDADEMVGITAVEHEPEVQTPGAEVATDYKHVYWSSNDQSSVVVNASSVDGTDAMQSDAAEIADVPKENMTHIARVVHRFPMSEV